MPNKSDCEIRIIQVVDGGKQRPRKHKTYKTTDPEQAVEYIRTKLL